MTNPWVSGCEAASQRTHGAIGYASAPAQLNPRSTARSHSHGLASRTGAASRASARWQLGSDIGVRVEASRSESAEREDAEMQVRAAVRF